MTKKTNSERNKIYFIKKILKISKKKISKKSQKKKMMINKAFSHETCEPVNYLRYDQNQHKKIFLRQPEDFSGIQDKRQRQDYSAKDEYLNISKIKEKGSQIQKYRIHHGLTQKQLAHFVNVNWTIIRNLEAGKLNLNMPEYDDILRKIQGVLKIE